jgi:hypothetical protein
LLGQIYFVYLHHQSTTTQTDRSMTALRSINRRAASFSSIFTAPAWLPILPSRVYPFGGSADPENVFVTRVTEDRVYYCAYPFYGAETSQMKSTFNALVNSALNAKIKQLTPYMGSAMDYDGWMSKQVAEYKELLAGNNILEEEDQTDYEELQVICKQKPSFVPSGSREDDLYYIGEQYGSTSLHNDTGNAHISTTRGKFKKLVQEKSLLIVSVKEGRFQYNSED